MQHSGNLLIHCISPKIYNISERSLDESTKRSKHCDAVINNALCARLLFHWCEELISLDLSAIGRIMYVSMFLVPCAPVFILFGWLFSMMISLRCEIV